MIGLHLNHSLDETLLHRTHRMAIHPGQEKFSGYQYHHRYIDVWYRYWRSGIALDPVSYTHLRAHETVLDLVCRLLLEKKKNNIKKTKTKKKKKK